MVDRIFRLGIYDEDKERSWAATDPRLASENRASVSGSLPWSESRVNWTCGQAERMIPELR